MQPPPRCSQQESATADSFVSVGAEPRGRSPAAAHNPANGQEFLDPTSWVGGVTPFLLESSSQVRSVPPPALNSGADAKELNEVSSLGRATGSTRIADQTYVAKWWQSTPARSWNEVARQLITRNALAAPTPRGCSHGRT